jgi:hypothetical protein
VNISDGVVYVCDCSGQLLYNPENGSACNTTFCFYFFFFFVYFCFSCLFVFHYSIFISFFFSKIHYYNKSGVCVKNKSIVHPSMNQGRGLIKEFNIGGG